MNLIVKQQINQYS